MGIPMIEKHLLPACFLSEKSNGAVKCNKECNLDCGFKGYHWVNG